MSTDDRIGKGAGLALSARPAALPTPTPEVGLKVDLHLHTSDDRFDKIPYDFRNLIDRAALLGFHVLAITNHIRISHTEDARLYASDRGILLLPGVELSVQGKHILLINAPAWTDPTKVRRFEDLLPFRKEPCLLIPAHPFFPGPTHFGQSLEQHADLWDGIELSHFYTRWLDFNRRARRVAEAQGIPLVGTSDSHSKHHLGHTFSIVDGPPTAEGLVDAVKRKKVMPVSDPHSIFRMARITLAQFQAKGTFPDHPRS